MKKLIIFLLLFNCSSNNVSSQQVLNSKYNLMPWPKNISEKPAKFLINSDVTISINHQKQSRVRNAAVNFLRRLTNRTGVFLNEGFPISGKKGSIQITYDSAVELNVNNNESYSLEINNTSILIHAKTDIGVLRALESLLQLVQHNATEYYFPGVKIKDSPRFVWRGLMIDVARHFQPVNVLKRNLDAMASVKMNVFHWHLTDDQGFRVESKVYPKLQELASDGLFYTQEQIKDVVSYANNLGIRVIPEFDVPGHASAILTAYPELGSKTGFAFAIERFSGVFDPTLDPTKELTYQFLENLFTEMAPLFPDEYFHIGGDENEGKHWDENKNIQAFKKAKGLETNHELQTYFNIKLEKILNKLGKKLMGWDEIMTPSMPTTAVIHSWRGENEGVANGSSLIEAAKKGYQTVLSNGYYIDRMLPVAHHYSKDPIGDHVLTPSEEARILGGEATMWSELVTPQTIDSRIWPRTAAIAERFWSQKEIKDIDNMKKRLEKIASNLEELGLTHIKNRAAILRSMTGNQDISSLLTLTQICEPLKIYARNKDGIEYKTFSPFNLFADACVVDASDAEKFNKAVTNYTTNSNQENKRLVLNYLNLWSENHIEFQKLQKNPKLLSIDILSQNLSKTAGLILKMFQDKNVTKDQITAINNSITELSKPVVDVEVVIIDALNELMAAFKTQLK